MDGQRAVAYGSMAGVAFGGFTWVVVAGHLIHDPVVSISAYAVALGIGWVGARNLIRFPDRRRLVLAIVLLFVVLVDWEYLAVVLPRIPAQGGSIYFGTSRSAYVVLQPVLLVGGLCATAVILWDRLRRR